ncbi:MAG: protein kinase, partial [Azospirillum sp.]|nr:protein kinase [Azospirillum sp.]
MGRGRCPLRARRRADPPVVRRYRAVDIALAAIGRGGHHSPAIGENHKTVLALLDRSRCPACFSPQASRGVCGHCGFDPAAAGDRDVLAPGTLLGGRYTVGSLLGRGGFGATYRGFDTRLASMVAIKEFFLLGGASRDADGRSLTISTKARGFFDYGLANFLDEARTLARLRPISRVVSVFDFFEENGTAYIIMDYICGLTLRQLQQRRGGDRIAPERALPVFREVLAALAEIHQEKILHSDISPDNVFVCGNGAVKLIDFGAARHATSRRAETLGVCLKPGYAPIEQYSADAARMGPWSDLYAAGATFYHVLTGAIPPESPDRLDRDTLTPISAHGISLDPVVAAAIHKALALRPDGRWQRAEDFAARLSGQSGEKAGSGMVASIADLSSSLAAHRRFAEKQRDGRRLDLSRRDLSCLRLGTVNMAGAELAGAVFSCSDLLGADFSSANLFCADFAGANLRYARFDNCDLRGARFDNADLTGSSLEGADCREGSLLVQGDDRSFSPVGTETPTAASFRTVNLSGAVLRRADLRSARFTEALLEKTDLSEADLRGASLRGARIIDVVFAGAEFAQCDFTGAAFSGVDTGAAEFRQARIVRRVDEIAAELQDKLRAHRRWVDSLARDGHRLLLKNCDIAGLQMAGVDWSAAAFDAVVMTDIDLVQAALSHASFRGCAMSRANLARADARGAQFLGCDLAGAVLSGALLSAIELSGGRRLKARFRDSRLAGAKLIGAKCEQADFTGADLRGADCRNADFTGANFTGANFTGANFTPPRRGEWKRASRERGSGCNLEAILVIGSRFGGRVKGAPGRCLGAEW